MLLKPREKKNRWPFIKKRIYPSGAVGWMVDTRTKDGGERRGFETLQDAETCAELARVRRQNQGTAAFGNVDLARYGKSVQDAISFYLAHLKRQESSATVNDAIKELVALKRAGGKSKRYCHDLELRLGRFAKTHDERTIASFEAKELDAWLLGLAVAPGTRNTFRRDLRTLFSFCEKRGYCISNEAKKTERANDVNTAPEILTVRQSAALLAACGDDLLPYVAIGLFAGLRAAELEKLDWSEIDLRSRHIEVTALKSKTRKRRLVSISDNLAAWIRPGPRQKSRRQARGSCRSRRSRRITQEDGCGP